MTEHGHKLHVGSNELLAELEREKTDKIEAARNAALEQTPLFESNYHQTNKKD